MPRVSQTNRHVSKTPKRLNYEPSHKLAIGIEQGIEEAMPWYVQFLA